MNDILGSKIGLWTVIERAGKKGKQNLYICVCECGTERIVSRRFLINGESKSCGCSRNPHGMRKTKFYTAWNNMKLRCKNQKFIGYKYYGGRGISVSTDWERFENFYCDMFKSYMKHSDEHGEDKTTLDRIDTNGNYTKNNCRWATPKVQCNNKRRRSI